MEKVERDLESLIKEKMESEKGYLKRLHDLEKKRRRLLKGKTKVIANSGGGNDSGEEEEISTIDSVKKDNHQGKNPQLEVGNIRRSVSHRCDLDRIDQIKKNLEKENLELFEQSCFGHLLKIYSNDLKFQGQVFMQLLMHLDMDASNKERQLVFDIGNSQIRFCAKDFALVTGLRLGTSEAATTSELSSIHKNVFGGRPVITLREFEVAFLRVSRDHEGGGELTLKLALLYFVLGILLPKHPYKTKVEARYLHLVEDLEKFNEFSWGRVSYEYLVLSMLLIRSNMDSSKSVTGKKARSKDARLDICINGFIFALQIWAYEVMPSLAKYCAENIKNSLTQPRILRWTTAPKKLIRFKNLKKFFAPGDGVDLVLDGIKREVEELSPQPKRAKVVTNKDEKCSTSSVANEDVIIIISDDEDDDRVASDDDSCSTANMDNYVASLAHK